MSEKEKTEEEKEFSRLMYEHSKVLENYGQKADKLLRSIQKNFDNDYTSFCVGFGSLAVIASVGLIAFGKSEIFAMLLLAAGFGSVIAGVYLRRLSSKEKLDGLPKILEFEKEQARIQQKERIYSRLWIDGKPKGLSDEQFTLLLSDSSIILRSEDE
jgi:hypothetical protein